MTVALVACRLVAVPLLAVVTVIVPLAANAPPDWMLTLPVDMLTIGAVPVVDSRAATVPLVVDVTATAPAAGSRTVAVPLTTDTTGTELAAANRAATVPLTVDVTAMVPEAERLPPS